MYKQKKKTRLGKSKRFVHWIKRKTMIIIAAFMLGVSNAMYDEDRMIDGNQNYIEQEQKKE